MQRRVVSNSAAASPKIARTASAIGLCGLLLALWAEGQSRVPWPLGRPLSDTELREQLEDALELDDRERYEALLDEAETGEDSEHIRLFQEEIDAGRYSLDDLFDIGDGAFEHDFRGLDGYGSAGSTRQMRIHTGVRGGLDTFSCLGCHAVGGPDGAGSVSQNAFLEGDGESVSSALVRNPPPLLGLGQIQALAAEMSRDLARTRSRALMEARRQDSAVRVELEAKGVSFGALTLSPDGTIDSSEVEGIDEDLVVRPFGWKGDEALLRRFIERAARIHFGIQSHPSTLVHRENPDPENLGDGPKWFDPDGDGVQREMEEGTLTALSLYLILLEAPVILPPRDPVLLESWARGDELFDKVGCEDCHRRTLALVRSTWDEAPDTTGAAPQQVRFLTEGEQPKSGMAVELFSDLKRHAMGPELADSKSSSSGVAPDVFLTRPLWGLAESAPYLHDGRAATLPEAILAHGGAALAARDSFADLPAQDQAALHVFLLSLTRTPKVRIAR